MVSTLPSVNVSVTAITKPRSALKVNDHNRALGSVELASFTSSAVHKSAHLSSGISQGVNAYTYVQRSQIRSSR